MIIYGALAIPIITVLILLLLYKHELVWWELLLNFGITIILIFGCKLLVEKVQTSDTEYWGGYVTHSEYYERWNEEVPCTHDKECCTGSGKNRSCTSCGTEHAYDVEDHPPEWIIYNNNGEEIHIQPSVFDRLCKQFSNKKFVDMHRDYHDIDGNMYVTNWDKKDETLEPVFTTHIYENRIQASTNVMNFEEVNPKEFGLYDYINPNTYNFTPIIGAFDTNKQKLGVRKLILLNSKFGQPKQVFVWLLIFNNKQFEAGMAQESYWKGGNKNEINICVGLDKSGKVDWGYIFSWTTVEAIKISIRGEILKQKGQEFNLEKLIDTIQPEIYKKFERRHFKEFDYITVEPPIEWILGIYIFILLMNVGIGVYVVKNNIN